MIQNQGDMEATPLNGTDLIPVVVPTIIGRTEPMVLGSWLVDVGERIEQGEEILEISLPGIVWDLSAPVSGRLESVSRFTSDALQPGDICGWIAIDADTLPDATSPVDKQTGNDP
ncbi:MAG: biotin/lipoyl-containing protein [Planctomycetaceae bacterium]